MTNRILGLKWLWGVFFLRAASLLLDCISRVLINDHWTTWVGYGITAGLCVCLFLLAAVNESYRKAAYFQAAAFGLTILNTFVLRTSAVNYMISACSILAAYHSYTAHSCICPDAWLSKCWMQLFYWGLLIAALKMLVSGIGAFPLILMQINITAATNTLMTLLFAAGAVLDVIYLVCLRKTIRLTKWDDSKIM